MDFHAMFESFLDLIYGKTYYSVIVNGSGVAYTRSRSKADKIYDREKRFGSLFSNPTELKMQMISEDGIKSYVRVDTVGRNV